MRKNIYFVGWISNVVRATRKFDLVFILHGSFIKVLSYYYDRLCSAIPGRCLEKGQEIRTLNAK